MNAVPPDDFETGQGGKAHSKDGASNAYNDREVRESELKKAINNILASRLRSVNSQEKQEIATALVRQVVTYEESYSGDLPHPAHLRGFEEIAPGSAKKIIDNAVLESEHRRNWENSALLSNFKLASRSQILGFILSVLLIAGGFMLGLLDKTIVACAMFVPGVVGTFASLIKVNQKQKQEKSPSPNEGVQGKVSTNKAGSRRQISPQK